MNVWIFEGLGSCSFLFLLLQFSLFIAFTSAGLSFLQQHVVTELFSWDLHVPRETTEHQKPFGSAFAIRDSKLKIEDP